MRRREVEGKEDVSEIGSHHEAERIQLEDAALVKTTITALACSIAIYFLEVLDDINCTYTAYW